jgi:hypothetical protein
MNYLSICATGALALIATSSQADEPKANDFAEGITLTANGPEPLLELPVPDKVYATVTQWNMADVRIFNANGEAVPHAFCNVTHPLSSVESMPALLYSIDSPHPSTTAHSNIKLRTADGTELTVQSNTDQNTDYAFRANASYILDVRKVGFKISSIDLDWAVPSGASETTVNILSSTDLSHWYPLVSNAKLIRAVSGDHSTLELKRIPLPANYYDYLRIEPTGNTLTINSATIQHETTNFAQSPVWYSAGAPHGTEDTHELRYENSHRVPVQMLRINPRVENSTMHVTVQSRDREDHPWVTQWQGEVFALRVNDQMRYNDVIMIEPTSAIDWRLLYADNAELPASAPSLELGYMPVLLNFMAQGKGPYTLAYGNARITTPSARVCEEMLTGVPHAFRQALLGTVTIGPTQIYAGQSALHIRKPIPTRTLLLWGILLIGAAVIMKIALSTLDSTKQQDKE